MINISDEVLHTKTAVDTELVFERQRTDLWHDLLPAEAKTLLASGKNPGLVRALYPLDLYAARERLFNMLHQSVNIGEETLYAVDFMDWVDYQWQRHSLSMRRLRKTYADIAPASLSPVRVAELLGVENLDATGNLYLRLDTLVGCLVAWAGADTPNLKLIDTGLMSNGVEYCMVIRDYEPRFTR